MKNRRISDTAWARAREDWISCDDPVAAIALRHGMSASSLSRRARAEAWPPRDPNDPAIIMPAVSMST